MQSLQIIFARNIFVVSQKLGDSMRQNVNVSLFGESHGSPVPATPKLIILHSSNITGKSKLHTFIGCLPHARSCDKFTTDVTFL